MEGTDDSSSDAIGPQEIAELEQVTAFMERMLTGFNISGPNVTGNVETGFIIDTEPVD
jgi:hypothetical protein